jgi:AsmA protein
MATIVSAFSTPPGNRLSRAVAALAACVIIVAMTAAAVPWLFSTIMLRDEIVTQIRQMTGLVALSQGRAVFVVLPEPHISIDDIRLADPSGALRIDARYLKGYLRVSALLRGRLEIASATLGEPEMVIDLDGHPMPPDSAIGRAANAKSASPQATSADEARLGVVSLVDGKARLKRRSGASDVLIDAINVTLDWRTLGAAASIMGTVHFRGQTADVAAVIARPGELLRGEQSALSLKIKGAALSLLAEGNLASTPRPQYAGRIVASAPSLRKLVETGGYFVDLPAPFEDFDLSCDASLGVASASFSNLHLQLDGNEYEGALAVLFGEKKPVLSGTLAANLLSLRPFLANFPPVVGRDGQWSHDPFDLEDTSFADLDLRVSATRLVLPEIEMDDAAFSMLSQNGRLEIALVEAKAYQGLVKGRASFTTSNAGIDMRASGVITSVDVASLWPSSIGPWKVAGAVTAAANMGSAGVNMSELMRNLDGRAQITLNHGEVGGINLEQALRSIDKRPLALANDIHYGGTAFESAALGLRIVRGVGEIDDGALRSPSLNLEFGGAVEFAERTLNLHGVASLAGSEDKVAPERPKFAFDVAGPWDDLALIPDAESLIRQSGAAAPLFSQQPAMAKPTRTSGDK